MCETSCTHAGLIKNDELMCVCVCAEEGVSVFAVGQGRAGLWVSVIFPLENKGVTWEQRKSQLTAGTTKDI